MENNLELYYNDEWNKFHAYLENGEYEKMVFNAGYGEIQYPMVIRSIDTLVNNVRYFDIVTPKGYSGPTVVRCENGREKELIDAYKNYFLGFCANRNIVSEYVRFNPWRKDYRYFNDFYEIKVNGTLYGIDLTVKDILMDEIPSKTRNIIRKSMKDGVKLEIDESGKTLDTFLKLYDYTIIKNNISKEYQFDSEKLKKYFDMLDGKIFIINALVEKTIISDAMFIVLNDKIYYNYSATNPGFYKYNAVSYILYEACLIGKSRGCSMMELGSGATENLRNFKKSFSMKKLQFDSVVGKAIRNAEIYEELVRKRKSPVNQNYFPEYRG